MDPRNMLRLENISKNYGNRRAVDNLSMSIKKASITILVGADGVGKSTIFKILVGLVKPDTGEIYLEGTPVGRDHGRITGITGYMPERFSLYQDLSVEENMNFFADVYGVPKTRREELKNRLLSKTGMLPFKKRRAGALSGGMKQKLALSTILLSSPAVIILDEPTTGVDPLSRIEFFDIIQDLKNEGKTVVISTPYLDEAEKGDQIVFIKDGHIFKEDTISHLKENFPARLYRILPKDNIFEVLNRLDQNEQIRKYVFIRGKYLQYMQVGDMQFPPEIPLVEKKEKEPTLEDIYIYHVRQEEPHKEEF